MSDVNPGFEERELERTINEAARLLKCRGYTVTGPDKPNLPCAIEPCFGYQHLSKQLAEAVKLLDGLLGLEKGSGEAAFAFVERFNAAAGAPVSEWQLIDTAPKDGTKVDLWHPTKGRLTDAFWQRQTSTLYEPSCWSNPWWGRTTGATHWMPLPSDPVGQQKVEKANGDI